METVEGAWRWKVEVAGGDGEALREELLAAGAAVQVTPKVDGTATPDGVVQHVEEVDVVLAVADCEEVVWDLVAVLLSWGFTRADVERAKVAAKDASVWPPSRRPKPERCSAGPGRTSCRCEDCRRAAP